MRSCIRHALFPQALAIIGLMHACSSASHATQTADAALPSISAQRAKQLVLQRYHELFADKYLLDRIRNEHVPFPQLTDEHLTVVSQEGDTWRVRADPPTGLALDARVAKDGSSVEILHVSYAEE